MKSNDNESAVWSFVVIQLTTGYTGYVPCTVVVVLQHVQPSLHPLESSRHLFAYSRSHRLVSRCLLYTSLPLTSFHCLQLNKTKEKKSVWPCLTLTVLNVTQRNLKANHYQWTTNQNRQCGNQVTNMQRVASGTTCQVCRTRKSLCI